MDKLTETPRKDTKFAGLRGLRWFSTKELALISVLSSLWIVSQLYLGPVISQMTHVHGVIQRVVGWFLMLTLAWLTGRFGRVTAMAAVASSATRIIRPGRVYSLFVGLGYALGGLTFDLLYFLPVTEKLEGRTKKAYLLGISALSGVVALIPYYLIYRLWITSFEGFIIWISLNIPRMINSVILNVLGTFVAISVLPQIEAWALKVGQRRNEQIDRDEEKRSQRTITYKSFSDRLGSVNKS